MAENDRRLLQLSPTDNVCVPIVDIAAGEELAWEGQLFKVSAGIPTGHKLAVKRIAAGAKVFKYGASIGSAIRDIEPGEYVHTHNLKSDYLPTYARGATKDPRPETDSQAHS